MIWPKKFYHRNSLFALVIFMANLIFAAGPCTAFDLNRDFSPNLSNEAGANIFSNNLQNFEDDSGAKIFHKGKSKLNKFDRNDDEALGRASLMEDMQNDENFYRKKDLATIKAEQEFNRQLKEVAKSQEEPVELGDRKTKNEDDFGRFEEVEIETIENQEHLEKCEKKQNKWRCSKILIAHPDGGHPFNMEKITSNLPMHKSNQMIRFGWTDHWHFNCGSHGCKKNFNINFELEDLNFLEKFMLIVADYDDWLRISVNDQQVFIGPYSGTKLELMGWVKIDDSTRSYNPEQKIWRTSRPNKDLIPYLKRGKNNIDIELIVGGKGGLYVLFDISTKQDKPEKDEWRESCVHLH